MELEKALPAPQGDGCLVGVVRIPVKIVAVLVVLPLRVVWDLLVAFARMLNRSVLGPLGQGLRWFYDRAVLPVLRGTGWLIGALFKLVFYWPWAALWRYVVFPVGQAAYRYLLRPAGVGIRRYLLVPLWEYGLLPAGRGIARLLAGAVRYLLVLPVGALYRYVLTPAGHGLRWLARGFAAGAAWLAKALFVWPWVALWRYLVRPVLVGAWRYLLAPVGRGLWTYLLVPLWQLLAGAWHLAGRVSRALGRGLVWLWRWAVVRPAGWLRRHVVTPVGNALRAGWAVGRRGARSVHRQAIAPVGHTLRALWQTSRLAVREVRDDVRKVLFGGPAREPGRSRARTLGSNTAVGDAPGPDVSLNKQG
ncbi:hypothetical protein [Streptomyces sp. NBC_01244]|uniref:hypothetical protein n=1 Tax=Streptomyces sp. NBC_01244 TaxID=2903797 RepID=UPI002E152716|nr:hypothetical protein OG247_15115 [Streptomyces sp. NBC_01244]